MIPTTYRHSVSSIMPPLDLNEVHNHHHLFNNSNHQAPSSSFSSPSYPILFNPPNHDQQGSYFWEQKHLPNDHEEIGKIIPSSESSWDHSAAAENHDNIIGSKVTVWEEDRGENLQADAEDGSMKWMPSKMRIMRKMMASDQTKGSYVAGSSMKKFEHQKQPLSPLGTDNSSNNYPNHSTNNTVRVCSDCHTTKTPLWRSGPRGPKSLCNACGIRQRKARRAMAAAAAANGTIVMAAQKSVKGKEKKKSKTECAPPKMKKKRKLQSKSSPQSRNKFTFEDLTLRLSKNVAFKQVFPQDEKEAAILLMALSYGLVHG
ncbi:PREDICTED: GATA transcription factor 21-like [Lupinus angustifolius]|uniref:GATA transcription factor 21-like n=1 Tax=Lupinus angustifolius TaxID=3871 RepID=UPI00092E4AAB|nr:PREDICTED: GATA transcription factor 21-like [Lupinus angustifolius]